MKLTESREVLTCTGSSLEVLAEGWMNGEGGPLDIGAGGQWGSLYEQMMRQNDTLSHVKTHVQSGLGVFFHVATGCFVRWCQFSWTSGEHWGGPKRGTPGFYSILG